jgi:hypothetical protein
MKGINRNTSTERNTLIHNLLSTKTPHIMLQFTVKFKLSSLMELAIITNALADYRNILLDNDLYERPE